MAVLSVDDGGFGRKGSVVGGQQLLLQCNPSRFEYCHLTHPSAVKAIR
jgi:hypothetical protein